MMIKEMTFAGKFEDSDAMDKEYWWKQTPQERLKIANDLILQIFRIGKWENFPMEKKLTSTRGFKKHD